MEKGILLLWIWIACITLHAQPVSEEGKEPIKKALTFSLHLGTAGSGLGLGYVKGDGPQKLAFGMRIFGVRDSREVKVESAFAERGSKFVYGKVNRFTVVSPFIGVVKELMSTNHNNYVKLSVTGQIGPALGFARPYYVDIEEQSTLGLVPPEPTPYDPNQHNYENIVGVSSIVDSRWDFKFVPGISSRVSLIVDLARKEHRLSAIELGINGDYFFDKVPLMAFVPNRNFFVAASLGLIFGMRN